MARSWSYRKVDHTIEVGANKKGGFPLTGWIIFGAGIVALCVYSALAINIVLHPVQIEENQNAPITTLDSRTHDMSPSNSQ